jgi:hypothetical protein
MSIASAYSFFSMENLLPLPIGIRDVYYALLMVDSKCKNIFGNNVHWYKINARIEIYFSGAYACRYKRFGTILKMMFEFV